MSSQEKKPLPAKRGLPTGPLAKPTRPIEAKAMPPQPEVKPAVEKLGSTPKPRGPPPPEHQSLLVQGPPCTVFSESRRASSSARPDRPVTPPKAPETGKSSGPATQVQSPPPKANSAQCAPGKASVPAAAASPATPAQAGMKQVPTMMHFANQSVQYQQPWPLGQQMVGMTNQMMLPRDQGMQMKMLAANCIQQQQQNQQMQHQQIQHQQMQPAMHFQGQQPTMQPPGNGPSMVQPQGPQMTMMQPMMQQGQGFQPTMHPQMMMSQGQSSVEAFCQPTVRRMGGPTCVANQASSSAAPGPQVVGLESHSSVPELPQDWKDWNESSKKPDQRGHRHTPAQVRREAWQREALIRDHFEAKLQVQKDFYEAKMMTLRAELVAAKAIMLVNGLNPENMQIPVPEPNEEAHHQSKRPKQN